ncbi:MAG: hypothetical protein M1831_006541 [Alyxoria varia]|nr:MAG: hypothetical protein M1831_006541 [Alyxoria varia]
MAFRQAFQKRNALPAAAGALTAAGAVLLPFRAANAEESARGSERMSRKPIYNDLSSRANPNPSSSSRTSSKPTSSESNDGESRENLSTSSEPTRTDRLASQIRSFRLTLYDYSTRAETSLNTLMSRALNLENDFTTTVASLAPPPSANEPLLPGITYVLVASLAGSIVARNRGVLLRAATPLGFGIAAAYAALPITVGNIEALEKRWEEKYPELRERHQRFTDRRREIWETGKEHSKASLQMAEGWIEKEKKKIEDWVRKGK